MSSLRPVDETIDHLLGQAQVQDRPEVRSLETALNCCSYSDISSPLDVPPADNSAMDGYAFKFEGTVAGNWLQVSDRIPAGYTGKPLQPGTVARIFTGAPIPAGADTVVMQENTDTDGERIQILKLPEPGDNVRARGQDIETGSVIVRQGDQLNAGALGLIASVGLDTVEVFQPLKVAIMSTGDELVEPGQVTSPGQIYNSNRYALSGLIREMGFEVVDLGIVPDSPEETEAALLRAAEQADVILSSGGVSVGEEDHVKAAVEKLGRLDVWKLAIKPGKPLAYGQVRQTPFFGLPGNPVSTFVTFLIVAKPYLRAMQGFSHVRSRTFNAIADFNFSSGSRREYLRVRFETDDQGMTRIRKFENQGSGIMTSVVWADALAEVEIGQSVSPGDMLRVYPV